MPLVTSQQMLENARSGSYAVPAFNIENMEMVQAVLQKATELRSPVMLQTTPSTVKYAGIEMLQAMVQVQAERCPIPVALHLDHGESFALTIQALRAGYTSVMIDGSKLPWAENIALTQKVVEMATAIQIPVEAELGKVGGKEDDLEISNKEAIYTDPEEARQFVAATGVHSLAVAIGTAHGFYKGHPKLDFDRLAKIRAAVDVILVLHGASGIPDELVRQSIALGVSKVNFATELRAAMTQGVREALLDKEVIDPKRFLTQGKKSVQEVVHQKIILCGSNHQVSS